MSKHEGQLSRDWLVKANFGKTNPRLGYVRNRIVQDTDLAIQVIAAVSGDPIGVWGDRPWFDDSGGPYVEPEEPDPVENLRVWLLPKNQECALNYSRHRNSVDFKMIIPANLPPSAVRLPLEAFDPKDGCFQYEKYIERVADWLHALRWAYIPLWGETGHAIVVASPANADLLEKVEDALRRESVPVGKLTPVGDGIRWPDL